MAIRDLPGRLYNSRAFHTVLFLMAALIGSNAVIAIIRGDYWVGFWFGLASAVLVREVFYHRSRLRTQSTLRCPYCKRAGPIDLGNGHYYCARCTSEVPEGNVIIT